MIKRTPIEKWILESTELQEGNRQGLEEYHLRKLRETISYAKKSGRFYKEKLGAIEERRITSFAEFEKLPFTSPEDLKDNSLPFLCVPQTEVTRIVTLNTTGTSGNVKRIYFSEEDMKRNLEFFKVGMSCLVNQEDKVLVLLPGNAYGTIGDFLRGALAELKIPCFVEGLLKNIEETEKLILSEEITCIVGIPLQVQYLSRMKAETFKKHIKKVLLSTDFVPKALVKELTETHGCQVFNHYGMTEMGYGAAVECEALDGYHMREMDLYFEIVNPETGVPVKEGELGEVVFTTLNRTAMPLIRYRTGDLASFKREKCSCGTFLKTMNPVLGRKDNKVELVKNVYLHMRELDELIFENKSILDYKATMREDGLLLELLITERVDFNRIKTHMEALIAAYLFEKSGEKVSIRVTEKKDKKLTEISNSMIKRKINYERKLD